MNTLHHIDCMEYMKDIPDNHFDLSIVDVPYGINQGGGNNHTRGELAIAKDYKDYGDTKSPDKEYFIELMRVSKNQIIWGANHFISKIPFDSPSWFVWDKINGKTDFADCELAWTSFNTAARIFRFQWQGMLQGNMKNKEFRIHPNQKPVAVYKELLRLYAKPGWKLLDTHSGSGSLREAVYDMGFDLESCELDPDYCRDNEARYQQHIKQKSLFEPEELRQPEQVDLFGGDSCS